MGRNSEPPLLVWLIKNWTGTESDFQNKSHWNNSKSHYNCSFSQRDSSIKNYLEHLSMSLWITKIKCLSLAVFLLATPTNKTVTGIAYTWGLLIANQPPGLIIMIDQSEILSRSQVQFITLFFGGAQLCCAFFQPQQAARIWCRKTNFLS